MRAVVQRVTSSSVTVEEIISGEIGNGLMVLLGISPNDTEKDIEYMTDKILNLRIFEDEQGKMNLSLMDIQGEILIVSQFTLYGDCRKGRRPNFINAAPPDQAKRLYEKFAGKCRELGVTRIQTGIFGARMMVDIRNDGPVTILLDSEKQF